MIALAIDLWNRAVQFGGGGGGGAAAASTAGQPIGLLLLLTKAS